jgi:hypothetical protein
MVAAIARRAAGCYALALDAFIYNSIMDARVEQ